MMQMIILEIVLLILLISSVISIPNDSLIAETDQGFYIGFPIKMNGINVNVWNGIPYAKQPIGNLRWMPPQSLPSSNGTKMAFYPNICPQITVLLMLMTESCLTLNVYAPENATNLPVYVWIHGGSFTSGAGILYDATQFVSTSSRNSVPIVIVTINYRLGLLGFLSDEDLFNERSGMNNKGTTGNYGILDQIIALDWIKKNIRAFGGNPEEITIGGESAGAISVTILLTSPLVTRGTFHRAIIQSGGVWPDSISLLKNATANTGNVLRTATNCATVECLRNLTVEQIGVVQNLIASKNMFGVSASPVVDGYVLNDIMENDYARGNFQKVPILVGSNTNETTLFTCPLFNGTASSKQVEEFFNAAYNTTIVSQIPMIYGPMSDYNNPLTYLNIVFSDSSFHCGSRRIASSFARSGLSVYFYTYNYLIPVTPSCYGVAHGSELPLLFPSLLPLLYPNYNLSRLEEQLSTNMMLYWANFIRSSNPNYNGSPVNWNTYQSSNDNELVIDFNSRVRNSYYNPTCSRLWDLYIDTNNIHTSSSSSIIYNTNYLYLFSLFISRFILRM